jgi:small subunit ribosomal protein S20
MADETKKKAAVKKPSALKRDIQNEKRRLLNRAFRSSVLTAIRGFESALSKKEAPEVVKTKLSDVYSMMDKGVKRGIYKANKAARTKSRMTARFAAI